MNKQDPLGPDHMCRREDPSYASVGEWYEAHRGSVPIQAAQALSQLIREQNISFADAFRTLVDRDVLILIEDGRRTTPMHRFAESTRSLA